MRNAIRYRVFENADSACAQAVANIAQLIRERATLGRHVVLGLTTGHTLQPFYEELIYQYREEGLTFNNVITFNLTEYLGLPSDHPGSLRSYMNRHFFDHVDLPAENIHFLPGGLSDESTFAACMAYEKEIQAVGGIDIQILGMGHNGHIGFNEPGSDIGSRTRWVALKQQTQDHIAQDWPYEEPIPEEAMTMGCGTILEARRMILLAWGSKKRRLIRRILEGNIASRVPASYLQTHPSVRLFIDPSAATMLRKAVGPV